MRGVHDLVRTDPANILNLYTALYTNINEKKNPLLEADKPLRGIANLKSQRKNVLPIVTSIQFVLLNQQYTPSRTTYALNVLST